MVRKFFIVSNSFSGTGKAQKALTKLIKRLDQEGFYYALFLTPQSEQLDEFIKENIFSDSTDVIVIGGDGTLNATLNAIKGLDVTLGIIPTGTGNDFVKTVNIGKSVDEQIETIVSAKPKTIDIGECNGRRFINGVGIGFDGQLVYDNIYKKSILTGHAKYYSLVFKILGTYKSRFFKIKIDDQEIEERLILMAVHNGTTFGGGFKLNPDGIIDDGLLNICTIGRIPGWKRFLNIGKLSFGKHDSLKCVKFYTGRKITIGPCDKTLLAHIDGEYLGEPPFEINILPSSCRVLVRS